MDLLFIFEIIALFNFFIIIYIFIGFPLLLFALSKLTEAKPIFKAPIRPSVTLLISCYNEEDIVRDKLINSLEIDYPKNRLEIIVISDGSTDRTDSIVKEYERNGVRLIRQEGRLGKTCGLNLAISQINSEIVVFSDANAMYENKALIHLVENFYDPGVGYVVGRALYADASSSSASLSENTYWNYEIWIKNLESKIHSVVGGDGAIYAIRRELYEPLESTDINDFVNPLQIISKGYRGVYEPAAVCYEKTAGTFHQEFKRKTRIVNRSFSGLLRVPEALNPFRTGIFSFLLFSHKLLRWFSGIFYIIFLICAIYLAFNGHAIYQIMMMPISLFIFFAYIGFLNRNTEKSSPIFYYPYYVTIIHLAALRGIYERLRGSIKITWEHHRSEPETSTVNNRSIAFVHLSFLLYFFLSMYVLELTFGLDLLIWKSLLWVSIILLIYAFFVYPAILYLWNLFNSHPVKKNTIKPTVTLLICAYNEALIIEEKVKNSLALAYPKNLLKIIIASDGSTDQTVSIAKPYENDQLEIIDYPDRRGKMGTINRTIGNIESDIVIFSDANTMLTRESIRKIVTHFADDSVGCVSADVVLQEDPSCYGNGQKYYYRYERYLQTKESMIGSAIGVDGGMYAIRRELFVPSTDQTILDDFVISMNIAKNGYRIVFDDSIKGYESNGNLCLDEFKRRSRVVAGIFQALKLKQGVPGTHQKKLLFCYVSHKLIRWFMPTLTIIILLSSLIIAIGRQGLVYDILLAFQIAVLLLSVIGFAMRNRLTHPIISIPFYFVLGNAAGFYGMYKGLFDKQPVRWEVFERVPVCRNNSFH